MATRTLPETPRPSAALPVGTRAAIVAVLALVVAPVALVVGYQGSRKSSQLPATAT